MITTDSPLQAAKERLLIPDLWQWLNLPGNPGRSCRSPFREDRSPSFSIYADGRKWKDHATGDDASRRLIEMAGVLPHPNERTSLKNFVHSHDAEEEEKAAGETCCNHSRNPGNEGSLQHWATGRAPKGFAPSWTPGAKKSTDSASDTKRPISQSQVAELIARSRR